MPRKVTHNNCPLCRKKFTAKRHSILRRLPAERRIEPSYSSWNWMSNRTNRIKPSKPRIEDRDIIVTVCGSCKSKIKSGHLYKYEQWCIKTNTYFKEHYVPIFDTDKLVLERIKPKKYKKSGGHGNYFCRYRGTDKHRWINQHNDMVKKLTNPNTLREEQKKWTMEETRQFNKLLGQETAERHAAYAELKRELAEEESKPLRNWLEK